MHSKKLRVRKYAADFFLSDNGGAHNNQSANYPLKGFKGTNSKVGTVFLSLWYMETE